MKLPDNSNRQPYFTIIIATLNADKTLEECLNSIIQQSELNKIEILVKDGLSTDRTISIIKKYNNYVSYFESSADSSVYDAWNIVLPRASGKWILFLGADDTLFDNSVISRSYLALKDVESSIDIAYGKVRLVSKENEPIIDIGKNWRKSKKCIKQKMCVPHQGIFHRNSLFVKYGLFSTDYLISSDYDFIRKALHENNVLYLDMIISNMKAGGISSDTKNTFVRLNEVRRINSRYGSKIPEPLWIITFANACFRHGLFSIVGESAGKYILDQFRIIAGLPAFWTKI